MKDDYWGNYLVEIKEFIDKEDAYTWYPPIWIEND